VRKKKGMLPARISENEEGMEIVKYFKRKFLVLVFLLGALDAINAMPLWAEVEGVVPPPAPGVLGVLQSGGVANLFPFLLMFGVMYFFVFRPQQQKMKQQQAMLTGLKVGDEVILHSGMLGTLRGITDQVVTVEIADQVRVKMMKTQVARKGSLKDFQEKSSG